MKTSAYLALFLLIFSGSWALTSVFVSSNQRQINLVKDGHHEEAIAQARELLKQLQSRNWRVESIDRSLLRLPDQSFAENEKDRHPDAVSFDVKHPDSPVEIYKRQIAFTCKLYVRRNYQRSTGPEQITSRPEGFFIVGWKNGRVTKVAVQDVRMYRYLLPNRQNGPRVDEVFLYVFPGMDCYSITLPKFPGL